MKYKVKHIPTGLYYQARGHDGSNLSRIGRIYDKKDNILSAAIKLNKPITVFSEKFCAVYKQTKGILKYEQCVWDFDICKAETNIDDWEIENLK